MTLDEALDYLDEKFGLPPLKISCDGDCGTELTRDDVTYSKFVSPMWMLLCPDCAEDAGWLDE